MALHLSRSERRRGSRRARSRSSKAKKDRFLALREAGASRGVIAAALGLPIWGVDELIELERLEEELMSISSSEGSLEGEGSA